jgi:hypothetical protein
MRFLAPPHQWFLQLAFLKIELWVYGNTDYDTCTHLNELRRHQRSALGINYDHHLNKQIAQTPTKRTGHQQGDPLPPRKKNRRPIDDTTAMATTQSVEAASASTAPSLSA